MSTCFPDLSRKVHMASIIKGGKRPKTEGYQWPGNLKSLMKSCWATDPCKRPSSAMAREMLNGIVEDLDCSGSSNRRPAAPNRRRTLEFIPRAKNI